MVYAIQFALLLFFLNDHVLKAEFIVKNYITHAAVQKYHQSTVTVSKWCWKEIM